MTTIRDTIRQYNRKVYVRIETETDGDRFLRQAEAEGFRFSDGVLPSARPWAKLFSLTPDGVLSYATFSGHMAAGANAVSVLRWPQDFGV